MMFLGTINDMWKGLYALWEEEKGSSLFVPELPLPSVPSDMQRERETGIHLQRQDHQAAGRSGVLHSPLLWAAA